MRITAVWACRRSGSARGWRSTRLRLADHDPGMRHLLFDFQNLLRKGIDFSVNLVDFFRERFDLRRRRIFWRLRESNGDGNKNCGNSKNLNGGKLGLTAEVGQPVAVRGNAHYPGGNAAFFPENC